MSKVRTRTVVLALGSALVLADASIVTLALPELLVALDTGVEGVAAVLAVYTAVLALALPPAWVLVRRTGPGPAGVAGFLIFGAASLACGLADALAPLLAARAVQAAGGALALVAAFALMTSGRAEPLGRRLWPLAAVVGAAAGPALGGALTQAFDWRAIFLVQAPPALAGALACAGRRGRAGDGREDEAAPPLPTLPAAALALLSAALTAVLFLLILLLVAGWSEEPLRAAMAVTMIPLAALAASRVRGDPRTLAAAGCVLVGGAIVALAFLPEAGMGWTLFPQSVAGFGMGLALPALAGALLPERTPRDAARLLAIRHMGIAAALVVLAPVAADDLDEAVETARLRGIAVVLDADLGPRAKLELAPRLLAGVASDDPRDGLRRAVDEQRPRFRGDDRFVFERIADREDEVLVTAVAEAFRMPFLLTGGMALLAALLLLPGARRPDRLVAAAAVAAATAGAYAWLHAELAPEPVVIADPCTADRDLPDAPGAEGLAQKGALLLADRAACDLGSSREELVLAIGDEDEARRFEERYGRDPREASTLLTSAIRG